MSRREGRDSHAKGLHTRSERDPSPKKSRKDGKATERTYSSSHHVDSDTLDRDQKQQRRLQDAFPLEIPPSTETKVQPDSIKEGLDKKFDGLPHGTKDSSDPIEVPTPLSYFQHDEHGSAGHGGRRSARWATHHGRWSNPKEQHRDSFRDKTDTQQQLRADNKNVSRHDGFFEMETEAPQTRKRPAFREKKMEAPPETAAAANGSEPTRVPTARREERGHCSRGLENKPDRPGSRADEGNFRRGDGAIQRGEMQRGAYQPRGRFGGGGMRGRDRFNGRRCGEKSTHRPGGFQAEKWKHDLFDEANKSPPPKNEEEQIAKVEALLAQ